MDELNQKLRQLMAEICTYPALTLEHRQKLSEVHLLVMKSGKLWKEYKPYYNDALQQMWEYCS
ncbi:MAG: sigma-70 family RNA polymerase sigma factor, partial [Symploca sp. SIO3E6]|nr:sigma-70 family RNA polymerase sigma factor [Caldora sp. SIO3E6]